MERHYSAYGKPLEMMIGKLGCIALLCAAFDASAQITSGDGSGSPKLIPRTKAEREAKYLFHHRILLNVQATDSSGRAVNGLNASNFTCKSTKSRRRSHLSKRSRA